MKHERMRERAIKEAEYIVANNATVRETAKQFMVSKTTVSRDMRRSMGIANIALQAKVSDILREHAANRHIKGGNATKDKYKAIKESK